METDGLEELKPPQRRLDDQAWYLYASRMLSNCFTMLSRCVAPGQSASLKIQPAEQLAVVTISTSHGQLNVLRIGAELHALLHLFPV